MDVSPSPLLGTIHARLEGLGLAPDARDWLVKALHPAASHEAPGIPDESLAQTVMPDYRTSEVIEAPTGLSAATWDLLLLHPPGDVVSFWWASGPGGTDFTAGATPFGCQFGMVTAQTMTQGPSMVFPTLTAGVPPVFGVSTYNSVLPSSLPWAWRRRYAGITAYQTASALVDQGTVYASTFPTRWNNAGLGSATVNSVTSVLIRTTAAMLPLDENTLELVSPSPYIAPARSGVYLPARFVGPVNDWAQSVYPAGDSYNIPGTGVVFCDPSAVSPAFSSGFTIPVYPSVTGATVTSSYSPSWVTTYASGYPALDSNTANMSTGVIIFRGLAPSASITVRSYFGLEVQPRPDSPHRQFTKPPVKFSPVACQMYHMIAHELQLGYPASYNSLGTLLSAIGGVARTLFPNVSRVVSGIAGGVQRALAGPEDVAPPLSEVQRVSVSDPRPVRSRHAGLPKRRAPSVPRSASRSVTRSRQATPRRRVAIQVPRRSGKKMKGRGKR